MELAEVNANLGKTEFTSEETDVYDQIESVTDDLHLDIESFYLFAKIFLDKIARFIEH